MTSVHPLQSWYPLDTPARTQRVMLQRNPLTKTQTRIRHAYSSRTLAGMSRYGVGGLGTVHSPGLGSLGSLGEADVNNVVASTGQLINLGTNIQAAAGVEWAQIAGPIVGIAIAAVTVLVKLFYNRNGPLKVAATAIVNKIEPLMQQNLAAYQAGPHTMASQAQALNNFDALWQGVLGGCGNEKLKSAGERCISERQRGGTASWCPKPGGSGCDWFALYRDPIANDTGIVDNPKIAGTNSDGTPVYVDASGNVISSTNSISPALLLGVAAVGLALWL